MSKLARITLFIGIVVFLIAYIVGAAYMMIAIGDAIPHIVEVLL